MPFILICFLFYCGRTMASQEATPSSQLEESNALDLPSACDIRDYVLQKPCQEANSEDFSSLEAFSFPCSSEVDPELNYADSAIWMEFSAPKQGFELCLLPLEGCNRNEQL
ncbi:shieldin complex subunit 1 isoform X3 [Trichechus manatus latirostris]|uniref:Shieldin complex subunit 1 isoform X3 n=1 Tax=Trichechus manatus latirostris TaxID=127582 RepID=A0A2Y9RP39_TRIMA|nr:shieldin complex subunit 1 isoform X3 [Trichechus manatus latirostris]